MAELGEPLAEPSEGPAAHSMDSEWFGVDELGHVALFETGSRGAIAIGHPFDFHYEQPLVDELISWVPSLRRRFDVVDRFDASGQATELPRPSELGLFEFVHHTDWGAEIEYSDLYAREAVPARPLKVAELPVRLRSILEPFVLIGVDFRSFARVQPAEHLPCQVWEGYLDRSGRVHPRSP